MSLSQDIAIKRATIIRPNSISYNFNIILQTQQYTGLAQLIFYIDKTSFDQLQIDFSPTTIQSIQVNSVDLPIPLSITNLLIIPRKYLQKGRNYLSVLYTNTYSTDGLGCNTFRDQKDLQYVYTKFQPYGANRVFPCFDQPDLKATMKLSVVNSLQWNQPVSNQPVASTGLFNAVKHRKDSGLVSSSSKQLEAFAKIAGEDTFLTTFETTELLPTYVFAFGAGYLALVDSVDGPVPISIYSITTNLINLQRFSSYILDVTQKAIGFFTTFFGKEYPFKKYDQIFLRGLSYWAMENAGMVVYDDSLIQTQPTELDYYDLADTLVHQLSHHWFGNYVTMKWWDDLWLNESFASFIASYALQQINDYLDRPLKTPPSIYFRDTKYRGYLEDQRNTSTHPVRGKVANTTVAKSIFDGITYNKGAAILNQLMFLVGQQNFSLALQSYFKRFAFSNATVFDLLQDMNPYFPTILNLDINEWQADWLQTSSLNVFQSIWDPTKTSISESLNIYQSPYRTNDSALRSHSIEIAFFDSTGAIIQSQLVLVDKTVNPTKVNYDGSKNVAAVLVNYNDYGYFQNYIDHNSLQFFMANINKITDATARWLIWFNISSMVRQALVSVSQFAAMIEVQLFDNNQPIDFLLDRMLDMLLSYVQNYAPVELAVQIKTDIFNKIYLKLSTYPFTENDTDRIQILYKHYIGFATTDTQKITLDQLLHNTILTNVTSIIEVDDQLCWKIVKKIFTVSSPEFRLSDSQKWDIFDYMASYDDTYRQENARIVCQAILANDTTYGQLYDSLLVQGLDLSVKRLIAEGLSSSYHEEIYNKVYKQKYFSDIVNPDVFGKLTYLEFQLFYTYLRPRDQNFSDIITSYQDVLKVLGQQPDLAAHGNNIKKIIDDLTMSLQNNLFNSDSNSFLTKIRADLRASYITKNTVSYISNVTYVPLDGTSSTYSGLTEITFTLNRLPKLLPIDFVAYQVTDLIVNGRSIVSAQNGQFLVIPRIYLQMGQNKIAVNYVNRYNNDGLGCIGYTDQIAQPPEFYTYTQFEPYSAHQFIPCFDQPNLKASVSFNIIVPTNWIAASNNLSLFTGPYTQADYTKNAPTHYYPDLLTKYLAGKGGNYYVFDKTENISTYLYCVIAGQYYSVVADATQQYKSIPMTLYSLQSYKSSLDPLASFIFQITYLSLQLFEDKFKIPYKFKKYDSAFCHEYKFGAMENPGLITFNDSYLYGEDVSVYKFVQLAVVIAHECAHNWFGNFVTMSWWDDLWLNQSFADFISYYCIDNIKDNVPQFQGLTSGWLFGLERAVGGYREDQITTTTHPIRADIPNTSLALNNFDSITYEKGSMTMKQLMFLMTENKFFQGLTSYFSLYGFGNATIDDFLGQMKNYFDESLLTLDSWKDMWILTPSLNVITVQWDPQSTSTSATLTINQSNFTYAYEMLRYHKVNVAFFQKDGSIIIRQIVIPNQPQTTYTYDASPGVLAILVNSDHQDFVKVRFDSVSQQFFNQNLSLIQDPLTRMVIYFYLNQQVRDGVQSQKVADYRDIIIAQLNNQPQDTIFQFELNFLNQATTLYAPSTLRQSVRSPLFNFVLSSLQSTGKNGCEHIKQKQVEKKSQQKIMQYRSITKRNTAVKYPSPKAARKLLKTLALTANRILILKDLLPASSSGTLSQLTILQSWLLGTQPTLQNYEISASQGWQVVTLIFAQPSYAIQRKQAAYSFHENKYSGIIAQLILSTCLTLTADDAQMEDIYTNTFKKETQSVTAKRYLALGWNNAIHQDILLNDFKQRIFQDIPALSQTLSEEHFAFFYTYLEPIDDDLATTISLYSGIKLVGSDMVGNLNNIKKIVYDLQLRQKLYKINTS